MRREGMCYSVRPREGRMSNVVAHVVVGPAGGANCTLSLNGPDAVSAPGGPNLAALCTSAGDLRLASAGGNGLVVKELSGFVGLGGVVDPSSALDVSGTVAATAFAGDGGGLTNIPHASLTGVPLRPVIARFVSVGSVDIANDTNTTIPFDAVDPMSQGDPTFLTYYAVYDTNWTNCFVNTGGSTVAVLVTYTFAWNANSGGGKRLTWIQPQYFGVNRYAQSDNTVSSAGSAVLVVPSGGLFSLSAYQDSGLVNATSQYSMTSIQIVLL